MVLFQNLYYDSFLNKYKDRHIIAYGMGGTFRDFLKMQTEKIELIESIDFLLDADPGKKGRSIQIGRRILTVQAPEEFEGRASMADGYVMLLFLADKYVPGALLYLDSVSAFHHMACLYGLSCLLWGRERYWPPYPAAPSLPKGSGQYEIPKRIHYCWFGEKELPEENRLCLDSWKNYCPDYEIILWDESKIDLRMMPPYVREAYQAKRYAFVSDYVRLLAIYQYGGFYFDTDVLLLKGIDHLRRYRSVYSFMEYGEINTGLGFGSVARAKELMDMLKLYEKIPFYDGDANLNLTPCPRYTNDYFRRRGIRVDNSLQLADDMLFLPSSYLCPLMAVPCEDGTDNLSLYALEEHTIGIHLCDNSWKSEEDKAAFEKKKEELRVINARLLKDWQLTGKRGCL